METAIHDLVDIRDIAVDKHLPREERIAEFVRQIKDPCHFKCGDFTVRARFAENGVTCYGYRKGSNGRLAIDEEAAVVVRRIFTLALETKHAGDIVRVLYADKIPTPGEYRAAKGNGFHDVSRCAGIWQRSTVLRILTDERYIGP